LLIQLYFYLSQQAAKELETDKGSIGAEHRVSSYEDFVRILKTELLTDSLVSHLTNSLAGWPGFKEVFAVSALEGNGVDDLRDYIIHSAQEAPWDFHPDLKTDLNPKDLVRPDTRE
jgi:GTPase Era involved in 16S rRNA processing